MSPSSSACCKVGFSGTRDTNSQPRRPFTKYFDPATLERGIHDLGQVGYYGTYGNGFYHGLQMNVEKRYAKVFSYGLAYIFSEAHGDGEDGASENGGLQDPRDRKGSRGRRIFDQRHAAVIHWVWELPFGSVTGLPGAALKAHRELVAGESPATAGEDRRPADPARTVLLVAVG